MSDTTAQTTKAPVLDHIPDDFTLADLQGSLTEAEIELLNQGEDPLFDADGKASMIEAEANANAEADAATLAATQAADAAAQQAAQTPKVFQYPDTSEIEAVLQKAEATLASIEEQYDDGTLTTAEYQAQQRAAITEQARAQVRMEQYQAQINQVENDRRTAFKAELDAFKTDNAVLWSDEHLKGWDQALRAVTANPKYAARPLDAQIELARDLYAADYRATHGKVLQGIGKAKPAADPEPEQRKGPRDDDRDEAITTLAGMNGDTGAQMDDGEFAAVDRAMDQDPIKGENMLKAFSADKMQRYLESAR